MSKRKRDGACPEHGDNCPYLPGGPRADLDRLARSTAVRDEADQWRPVQLGTIEIERCPRCNRPLGTWPLQRPNTCSPKDWVYCIRRPSS
jgi:hypothetical protein